MNEKKKKVIIMMPAFNTSHILEKTVNDIPKADIDEMILVDDGSTDSTVEVAKKLGLTVVSHQMNKGYGAAQKTGYALALQHGADVVVMVHSDHQYDPTLTPKFIELIISGKYDAATGSRMLNQGALKGGMPWWKYIANRFLTRLENFVFNTNLSDYHNGFRAYSSVVLKAIPFMELSDKFDFDTDIIIQIAIRKLRIAEVAHTTRYRDENSQMPFSKGIEYGLSILRTAFKYMLHRSNIKRSAIFETNQASHD